MMANSINKMKKTVFIFIFLIAGCSAKLTFIDNTDGKAYIGHVPSATSSTGQATALIAGEQYSGPWVFSAQGGGMSVGFGGMSGTAYSGAKAASFYGTGNSFSVNNSAQGNGLLNMTGSNGSFIKCVFDYNKSSNSGIGKCQRNDGRIYDLTIVTGAFESNSNQNTSLTAAPLAQSQIQVGQESSPINPEAYAWNSKSLESGNAEKWVEAIRTSSAAIVIDPKYIDAYLNRCRAYIGYGELDEAAKDCNEALKLEPTNMIAVNNLAVISARQGNESKALDGYEKACLSGYQLGCDNFKKVKGYSPKDTSEIVKTKNEEAVKAFSQKDWVSVIAITTEIIRMDPKNSDAFISRSGAYANTGKLDDALSDVDVAIRLNPNEPAGYNNRGFIFELQKNTNRAILQYEIACSLNFQIGCSNLKRLKQN
jgi:tetratricopeptide (TPR) repeat protein